MPRLRPYASTRVARHLWLGVSLWPRRRGRRRPRRADLTPVPVGCHVVAWAITLVVVGYGLIQGLIAIH